MSERKVEWLRARPWRARPCRLIDAKIWIQYDGTEEGVAPQIVAAGVPRDRIVLAFKPPDVRRFAGFAAA